MLLQDMLSQVDHLDQATSYIKDLRGRIERMKQRGDFRTSAEGTNKDVDREMTTEFRLPVVEVRHQDLNLEVVLISGLEKRFKFHQVISVLEEEGAEVLNANFSVVGEMIFHTIHSQVIAVSVLYCLLASFACLMPITRNLMVNHAFNTCSFTIQPLTSRDSD